MIHKDRTSEFFSLCQSLPSSNIPSTDLTATTASTGRYNNDVPSPLLGGAGELRTFHQTASFLSQKIYSTSALLNQLTTLIHSRSGSLFVDESSQVNSLVLKIKSNIETLNSELDGAQLLIERNKRRTGRQAGLEASNLVNQLKDEFFNTTQGFKDILKVRSERMKVRNDRQSEVLGFDKLNSDGDDLGENISLLGNKPRIYENSKKTEEVSGGIVIDNGFDNSLGGGSVLLNSAKKMDGPRLDLTSAISGQKGGGMPGGESSMQLPRPYNVLRQRNISDNAQIQNYSGSTSSIYYNSSSSTPKPSSLPVYSPIDLQRMEAASSQQEQLQLIPDQNYLRQRADAMSEVETNIVELGTIFNKLAVMVNEHQEMVQRVEDNVDNSSENIGLSMEALMDTMGNLRNNRVLFLKVFSILVAFVILFITFFA